MKAEVYTVEGLAYWAKLDQPRRNPFQNEDQYSIKLYIDTRNKKLLESLNLTSTVKKDDIGENFNFVLNAITKSCKKSIPPKVFDCDMNDVTHDVLIGNGSKVSVEFAVLEVPAGPAKGKNKAFIRNVQIIDLVEYEGSGGGASTTFAKRDDGFTASSNNAYIEEQLA